MHPLIIQTQFVVRAFLFWVCGEVETVARELGVEPSEVREMESRLAAVDSTFDMPTDEDVYSWNDYFT